MDKYLQYLQAIKIIKELFANEDNSYINKKLFKLLSDMNKNKVLFHDHFNKG